MQKGRTFSAEDRRILESYIPVVEGLAAYLGGSYEITLHSLEDLEHSVIKIMNGYHTGRTEGSPITDLALTMLDKLEADASESDHQVYFCRNRNGEPMKSTTIAIRGKQRAIIGLLCMNLYLGTSLLDHITDLMPRDAGAFASENFAENSSAAVRQKLEDAIRQVGADSRVPASMRNKEIIRLLNDRHVFELKNAVDLVAGELGISANTVYFHLRNFAKGK